MTWKWEQVKDRIEELYINQDKSLNDVMLILQREYGFAAKKRAYEKRLRKWGFSKKMCHKPSLPHPERLSRGQTSRLSLGDPSCTAPSNKNNTGIQTEFPTPFTFVEGVAQELVRPADDIGFGLFIPELAAVAGNLLPTANNRPYPLNSHLNELGDVILLPSQAEAHCPYFELATNLFRTECLIRETSCPAPSSIKSLVMELESQPLAIEIAITYITTHGVSVPEYIELHRKTSSECTQKFGGSPGVTNYTESSTFEISLQMLSDEHHRFLLFCSFLDGSRILLGFLSRFLNYSRSFIDRFVLKILQYRLASQDTCPEAISISPNLQAWLQKRLPSDECTLIAQREVITKMGDSIFLNHASPRGDWKFAKLAIPHLEAVITLILQQDSESFWDEDLFKAVSSIANVTRRLEINDKVILVLEHVHRLMQRILGEQHPYTLDALNTLSVTYISTKNWVDAERHLRTLVSSRRDSTNRNEFCYLTELSNLVRVLIKQGHVDEARGLQTTISDSVKRIDPKNQYEKARVETKLGESFRLCGNLVEAEGHLSRLHNETRAIMGGSHPSTLRVLDFLCHVYLDQKNWLYAERSGLELVKLSKGALGGEQVDTVRRIRLLKQVYQKRDEAGG